MERCAEWCASGVSTCFLPRNVLCFCRDFLVQFAALRIQKATAANTHTCITTQHNMRFAKSNATEAANPLNTLTDAIQNEVQNALAAWPADMFEVVRYNDITRVLRTEHVRMAGAKAEKMYAAIREIQRNFI
jgi:hypothetical protein